MFTKCAKTVAISQKKTGGNKLIGLDRVCKVISEDFKERFEPESVATMIVCLEEEFVVGGVIEDANKCH